MSELEADLIFLNFLPIDKALHEDSGDLGQSHAQEVRERLQTLTQSVADFAKRFDVGSRLKVWVISDHGSTRIAADADNVLDKSFYKELADKKHHRYLALSDEKFAALPPMVAAQCFLHRPPQVRHASVTIWRRATTSGFRPPAILSGCMADSRPKRSWCPSRALDSRRFTPQNPTLRLIDTEFRLAVASTVRLEIGNPNPYALSELSFRLNDGESEEIWIESLGAQTTQTIEFPVRFRKLSGKAGADKTRSLEVAVRYECQGREFAPANAGFEVTIKTLMEVEDDFDF